MTPRFLVRPSINRSFFDKDPDPHLQGALATFAEADASARGAIFTRHEVVTFLLDLAGYTADQHLWTYRILEPACGQGDFLSIIVDRLITAYQKYKSLDNADMILADLADAVMAIDLHEPSLDFTRKTLLKQLEQYHIPSDTAQALTAAWIHQGDFLLSDLPSTFTHVVGNPPYVRQEAIPSVLLTAYRARYTTMIERADLYVPFIEHGLQCLAPGGTLGIICSDRWMKNTYGAALRHLIANGFHLAAYVDMVNTPAFHQDVTAYPAITIIRREAPTMTRIAHQPSLDPLTLATLAKAFQSPALPHGSSVTEVPPLARGSGPWLLHATPHIPLIRRLEANFPTLEETGCRISIGVATGADRIFIAPYDDLPFEDTRKLPLVKPQDIAGGVVEWKGLGILNPFSDDGSLVDLQEYPRLASYLALHESALRARHCARINPQAWYRTIDRITPGLITQPKLLIPDIKGDAHIVYENGQYYPHHNLYVVTSSTWDLHALQAVLQAQIAHLFVAAYSPQMRGGYFRFQAQYLRRIRIPVWTDVSLDLQNALRHAGQCGDRAAGRTATFELYQLTRAEQISLMTAAMENCDDA